MRKIIVAIALFYGVALRAQTIIFLPLGNVYVGLTVCSEANESIILINWDIRNDKDAIAETLAHESVHVRQAKAHDGGCKGAQRHYQTDPQYRLDSEWEAYCVDAVRDVVLRGYSETEAVVHLVEAMSPYPSPLNPQQVVEKARLCLRSHYTPGTRYVIAAAAGAPSPSTAHLRR